MAAITSPYAAIPRNTCATTLAAMNPVSQKMGEVHFSLDGSYPSLKSEMLEYAEEYLSVTDEDGTRRLRVLINDDDAEMRSLAARRGLKPMKIERVLWRGFNHPGEPPPGHIRGRLKHRSAACGMSRVRTMLLWSLSQLIPTTAEGA